MGNQVIDMDALIPYALPVKGLGVGIHRFDFKIDQLFFEHFENSPIQEADIDIQLDFDKRIDMYVLDFRISGTVKTECDRCLAAIDLPLENEQQLIVKFSHEPGDEEAEIVYVSPDIEQFNIAQYIYEYVVLSMPIIKVYDCQDNDPLPCDKEMLERLEAREEEDAAPNPIWDELRKLTNNDN